MKPAHRLYEFRADNQIDILAVRKQHFRQMVIVWYTSLVKWTSTYPLWEKDARWNLIPVVFAAAQFLGRVKAENAVDFICLAVIDPVQYLLADPEFQPDDLLKLPRISKQDWEWGCYFDPFTDLYGRVTAFYSGSATGLGDSVRSGGLIGRLQTYFGKSASAATGHDRLLATCRQTSDGRGPNFRKATD